MVLDISALANNTPLGYFDSADIVNTGLFLGMSSMLICGGSILILKTKRINFFKILVIFESMFIANILIFFNFSVMHEDITGYMFIFFAVIVITAETVVGVLLYQRSKSSKLFFNNQ